MVGGQIRPSIEIEVRPLSARNAVCPFVSSYLPETVRSFYLGILPQTHPLCFCLIHTLEGAFFLLPQKSPLCREEPLEFELPRPEKSERGSWRRWIDTFLEAPQDIVPWQEAPPIPDHTYKAGPRSVVVLWASLDDAGEARIKSGRPNQS